MRLAAAWLAAAAAAALPPLPQPAPPELGLGDAVEFNTVQRGWLPATVAAVRDDSYDVQSAAGYFSGWRKENVRRRGCPLFPNTTLFTVRERVIIEGTWASATPETLGAHIAERGLFRGLDSRGRWQPLTITGANPDGSFRATLDSGVQWGRVRAQHVRMHLSGPSRPEVRDLHRSACADVDPMCVPRMDTAAFARADAACLAALPPQAWARFSESQAGALPPSALSALPAASCALLAPRAARTLRCYSTVGAECAQSLGYTALQELSASCVRHLPDRWFAQATTEQFTALLGGRSAASITRAQAAALSADGCAAVDMRQLAAAGPAGDALCWALPLSCWTVLAKHFRVAEVSGTCLSSLSPRALAEVSDPRNGADSDSFCELGAGHLVEALLPQQRAALHPAVCEACTLPQTYFRQCPRVSLVRQLTRTWTSRSTTQCLILALAAVGAFLLGVALQRRRQAAANAGDDADV
eukprot:TRINITY_DN47523_c0_g1_i1.p1 TRINITY_DN47523_c0_g1~~TRINITY_DN47523_c0_g1_i1.p1  ORF type:complete len:472 (+),score=142.09 TRINITY_DN47523_c0_g1_i1:102-1517(+)